MGTRAAGECFHRFFEFSQTFTSRCFYDSIETRRTCYKNNTLRSLTVFLEDFSRWEKSEKKSVDYTVHFNKIIVPSEAEYFTVSIIN